MNKRAIDMRAEKELASFLDVHLYPELLDKKGFSSFKRITDKAIQQRGIDVVGKTAAAIANIDEKAQLHYINNNLPTFAFELSFLLRGEEVTGWFLNDRLETTHYLLLWPNAKTAELSRIKSSDFTVVYGAMISKVKLKRYLSSIGLDSATLLQINSALRRNKTSISFKDSLYDGIAFSYSASYLEAPINIVIKKPILASIADVQYTITPENLIRYK